MRHPNEPHDEIDCESCAWSAAPARVVPPAEEIHVWRLSADAWAGPVLDTLLSADERARASRFLFAGDRDRFVRRRSVLRVLLGRYVGARPEQIAIGCSERGKPYLQAVSGRHPLRFNVSHAGELSLLSFAWQREVGVDVARIAPVPDAEAIAARFFAASELDALRSLPKDAREAAFFTSWVRLEALTKATGEGLVRGAHERPAAGWTVRDLSGVGGCAAAVAIEGPACPVRCWDATFQYGDLPPVTP